MTTLAEVSDSPAGEAARLQIPRFSGRDGGPDFGPTWHGGTRDGLLTITFNTSARTTVQTEVPAAPMDAAILALVHSLLASTPASTAHSASTVRSLLDLQVAASGLVTVFSDMAGRQTAARSVAWVYDDETEVRAFYQRYPGLCEFLRGMGPSIADAFGEDTEVVLQVTHPVEDGEEDELVAWIVSRHEVTDALRRLDTVVSAWDHRMYQISRGRCSLNLALP